MMNLYLVRHGEAMGGHPDSKRVLTNQGISSLKNSIKLWKQYFNRADFIITSPLNRTKQTGEIIKKHSVIAENSRGNPTFISAPFFFLRHWKTPIMISPAKIKFVKNI